MRLGALMNATISTAVYVYLVAQFFDRSNRRFGAYVVIAQITQTVIGIYAILSVFYYKAIGAFNNNNPIPQCCQPASIKILLANLGFYIAFFYLFCQFYYKNFVRNRSRCKKRH